ncbi:MAG: hypothetical protein H0U12_07580 [Thermoleophilaceae bacterium]|nr:hypothetical protein [Thermoleophilaceae bacterium]
MRASLGTNASAFAYSVMITATYGVLTTILGASTVLDAFTFVVGAATAFTLTEAVASRGFRVRMRGERPDVVVLGSAISYPSTLLAVGAGALAGEALGTGVAWPAGSFSATMVFLLVGAVELLLGKRVERLEGVEDERS